MEKFGFENFNNTPPPEKVRDSDKYENSDPAFDEKFATIEKVGDVDTINIESKEDNGKHKLFFAPGFSRTPKTFKNTMREFYERNRGVVSLSHPRIFGEVDELAADQEMPKEIMRRATSLANIMLAEIEKNNAQDLSRKLDIAGQSLGGIDAILAAIIVEEKKPGSIGNIVLVDPAGIVGEDSGDELKKRFKNQVVDNKEVMSSEERPLSSVENQKTSAKEFFKYLLKNPRRALKEIEGMTAVRLEELIVELKRDKNIGVSIIHGVDDKTFPMGMVQDGATERGLAGAIDGFYSVKGGHNELYLNPEKYVGVVDEALTTLQAKENN